MSEIAAILADWGTTNRRAWAVDRAGNVLEQRQDEQGLLGIRDGAFESSFRAFAGNWLGTAPGAPVLMAGMVGSKLGWREAPYLEAPVPFPALTQRLAALPDLDGHPVRIVPGISCRSDGRPDVMRGEECQLYGLSLRAPGGRLCVHPGTHSKWARIADGGIAGFRTYMTGEVFAQLSASGTLAQLMRKDAPHDEDAFRRGLDAVRDTTAGGLLHLLFSVRSLGLFAELKPEVLASYLSGLLIGAELRDGVAQAGADQVIAVIGSPRMTGLYVGALQAIGARVEAFDGDALFRDALLKIGLVAGLLR